TTSNDGMVTGFRGNGDYWLTKIDSQLAFQWAKCLGGSKDDGAKSIKPTWDGGYIISGFTNSDDGDVSGWHDSLSATDYWIVKVDASGNIQWQKALGGTRYEKPEALVATSDSGFVIIGHAESTNFDVVGLHNSSDPGPDAWLIKLSSQGAIMWQ